VTRPHGDAGVADADAGVTGGDLDRAAIAAVDGDRAVAQDQLVAALAIVPGEPRASTCHRPARRARGRGTDSTITAIAAAATTAITAPRTRRRGRTIASSLRAITSAASRST